MYLALRHLPSPEIFDLRPHDPEFDSLNTGPLSTSHCLRCMHQENMSMKYVYSITAHFYTKRGNQGRTLFFILVAQNIDCGYSLELPRLEPLHN